MQSIVHSSRLRPVFSAVAFSAAALLCACGSGGSQDSKASQPAAKESQTGALVNIDGAINNATVAQYKAVAQAGVGQGPVCQAQVTALDTASSKLSSTISSNSDLEASLATLKQALSDLATCLKSFKPDLPALPDANFPSNLGANVCSVVVVNGQQKQVGDCSNCSVQTTTAGMASVVCGGSGGTTGSLPVGGATAGGATAGATTGTIPSVSNTCQATVVNGQVAATGDCSNCQVKQMNASVTVVCGTTGSIPGGTVGGVTGGSSGGGTLPTGTCQAMVVNGQLQTSGDCSKCDVRQDATGGVSVMCHN